MVVLVRGVVMGDAERAWLAWEVLHGRRQVELASLLRVSPSAVCQQLRQFRCDWGGGLTNREALGNYCKERGAVYCQPVFGADRKPDEYCVARREHIALLRSEGLRYRDIGERIGCSAGRARELLEVHERWLSRLER
jgi:hypothetical protein